MRPSESVWVRGSRFAPLLLALLLPALAAAQDDDAERTAVARSLFLQGVELSDRGRWDDAADHFRRSLSLRYSPVVAFNFGTALVHVGRLVEASELFRRASRDADAPQRLRDAARAQLEIVEPRLGRLTVELRGPAGGVVVELDGDAVPPEMLGVAAPSDPGHRVLRALRDAAEIARTEVDVPEGGEARVRLEVPALIDSAMSPSEALRNAVRDPVVAPAGGDDTALWAGIVTGVLVLGAAAVITTVLALDAQHPAAPIEGNLGPSIIVFE